MKWILLAQRYNSILESSLMILSFSDGLNKELSFGYTESIVNHLGKTFVPVIEETKIHTLTIKKNPIEFIDKLYSNNRRLLEILRKSEHTDYLEFFKLLIQDYTDFYIAKISSYEYFENDKVSNEEKLIIEKWRNDNSLYKVQSIALRRLSKQFKLPVKILENCTYDEIKKIINGEGMDLVNIQKRSSNSWTLKQNGDKVKFFLEDLDPTTQHKIGIVKSVKGKVAFSNNQKITGVVGKEILVEISTTPNMISKIKTMKAVITDEGGILSHAAITAREFRIPTIIGTKIATQVLKNGDLVEIDQNKGIIKKLNK